MSSRNVLSILVSLTIGSFLSVGAVTSAQASPPAPMVMTFSVAPGVDVTLPIQYTGPAPTVDWGDGTIDNLTTPAHTYSTTTTVTVQLTQGAGTTIHRFGADNWLGAQQLRTITTWGDLSLTSLEHAFSGSTGLTNVPATLPLTVTNLDYLFSGSWSNAPEVSSWNTANVTSMVGTFQNTRFFNGEIGSWNTGNVTNMSSMFLNAGVFNKYIGEWDTSSLTHAEYMFASASNFDHNLSNWNITHLGSAAHMFSYSAISPSNLSKILFFWWFKPHQENVTFGAAGRAIYPSGEHSVEDLVASSSWIITYANVLPASQFSISSFPTARSVPAGQLLSTSALSGGSALVPGQFVFFRPNTEIIFGDQIVTVFFYPDDFAYSPENFPVTVTGTAAPTPSPTPSPIASQSTQTSASSLAATGSNIAAPLGLIGALVGIGAMLIWTRQRRENS